MSIQAPDRTATRTYPIKPVRREAAPPGGWWSGLGPRGGRAFGALFPGIIGFLAAVIGLGGAVAVGVFGYVLAIAALRFLPETHGKELVPVE
jgi:hypothetical protein